MEKTLQRVLSSLAVLSLQGAYSHNNQVANFGVSQVDAGNPMLCLNHHTVYKIES